MRRAFVWKRKQNSDVDELTVLGPAPMMIASPEGGILKYLTGFMKGETKLLILSDVTVRERSTLYQSHLRATPDASTSGVMQYGA